jgi:competence CoiA-like predicted nuclease
MKNELLYVTAFNEQGKLVKANDAVKTGKYICPVCKNNLILKKSGKTGKDSRRPHFAHYKFSQNCTPESVLHFSFKYLLLEYIKDKFSLILAM